MGRKLDVLLGRNFRATKFRPLLNLALTRLTILTNQRRVKRSHAHSDVLQLLQLPNHHRALLRVETLIQDQNVLDAYALIEAYLNLLIERTSLLEQQRECPEELKEAVSGLIFAASRCGDFPELHEIKSIFTTRFGKEFTARAVELRNNCGVSPLFMQKLSTRQPNLDSKMDMLKAIASENGISLQLHQSLPFNEEKLARNKRQTQTEPHNAEMEVGENLEFNTEFPSGPNQKYKDVADAAQAAFESAAQAAAAARAAMELSRSEPHHPDSGTSPPHDKQDQKKSKPDIEYRNRREKDEEEEEDVSSMPDCSSSSRELSDKENREVNEERGSNVEIGLDMETEVTEDKPSFRLNLDRKIPMSVRTRRMRGY